MRSDVGHENTLSVHVTFLPYIGASQELKTKPTQHSVKELRAIGIQPDILICRTDRQLSQSVKKKIALHCNLDIDSVTGVAKQKGFLIDNQGQLGLSLRTNEMSINFMKKGSAVIVGPTNEQEAVSLYYEVLGKKPIEKPAN